MKNIILLLLLYASNCSYKFHLVLCDICALSNTFLHLHSQNIVLPFLFFSLSIELCFIFIHCLFTLPSFKEKCNISSPINFSTFSLFHKLSYSIFIVLLCFFSCPQSEIFEGERGWHGWNMSPSVSAFLPV